MKRELKKDIENGLYKNTDNIASLIPYILENIAYSLPVDADPILRKYVAASIYKYRDRDVPYEYILDNMDDAGYSDENSFSQYEMVRHIIADSSVMVSKIIDDYFQKNSGKGLCKELFVLSMGRLCTSFKSAVLLLNNGFFVEVVSIFRLIIEQLAWGCYLLSERDDKKVFNNRTQSNVKYLRKELGDSYGTLYGYLSSEAHLEPKEIGKYLKEEEDGIAVRNRSGKKCQEETVTLLELFRAYGEVIWKGMNYFGIVQDIEYYRDWYELHQNIAWSMGCVLNEKAKIESI